MNNSLRYALGVGAVILTSVNSFAVGTKLDDFDSFAANYATTGAGGLGGGFVLNINSAATATDGTTFLNSEPIQGVDTDFVGLVRRASLTSSSDGVGTSDLYNGQVGAGPTYLPSGALNYNNGNRFSTATIVYTFPAGTTPSGIAFPSGVNLSSFSQFDFDFIFPESGLTMGIQVASATGGEGPYTMAPISVPTGGIFTYSIPFSSLSGPGGSVWDSVRSITFTLSNVGGNSNGDLKLDAIGFSNPSVPEAEVVVPSIAFAAGIGLIAWRRRQSK